MEESVISCLTSTKVDILQVESQGSIDTYMLLSHEELTTVASPGKSKHDDKAWNANDSTLTVYNKQ